MQVFLFLLHHLLDIHLLYTYIECMKKTEWKTEEKRHQNHREFGRRERLIKHTIEIFDLVDITPAAMAGKVVDHRFLQSDVLLAAARYAKIENVYAHVAGNP